MGEGGEIEGANRAQPPPLELDELVFECLERIESEGAEVLAQLCREHPAVAPLLLERVRALIERGLLDVEANLLEIRPALAADAGDQGRQGAREAAEESPNVAPGAPARDEAR